MRLALMVLWMMLGAVTPAMAQLNIGIGIGLPGVSIGINLPVYPELVQVPGYPVYYAPRLNTNYFFYDGMYWVYEGDNWYASSWYNGPWGVVGPEVVPVFMLRIPVRYYRAPPGTFVGGARMPRRAGASAGAMTGSSVAAVGIAGIAVPRRRPRRYRRTSGSFQALAIRKWNNSARFKIRIIATSRTIR